MICPKCKFEQSDRNPECLRCGIVFKKYRAPEDNAPREGKERRGETGDEVEQGFSIKGLLFDVEPDVNPFFFGGRALLFLVILVWGGYPLFRQYRRSLCSGDSGFTN